LQPQEYTSPLVVKAKVCKDPQITVTSFIFLSEKYLSSIGRFSTGLSSLRGLNWSISALPKANKRYSSYILIF
jgi:hypothetical protein